MRSIRNSKFITISSGEKASYKIASETIEWLARATTESLKMIMPVKLVKVEVISFDRTYTDVDGITVRHMTIRLATGLMVKL